MIEIKNKAGEVIYIHDGVTLRNSNLHGTDLRYGNLRFANLCYANLCNVDLRYADLRFANLRGTNLRNVNFRDADLRDAYLIGAELPDFQIPQDIDLTVWGKKNGVLVEMKVPQSAKRTSCLINRKCRAEFVDVIKVHNRTGKVVVVNEYGETTYEDGKRVHPHDYCDDIRIDCAPGIHFWLTKEEAEAW